MLKVKESTCPAIITKSIYLELCNAFSCMHITTSVTGPIIINMYQKPKVNIFSYVMVVINKNASDDRKRVYVRDSVEVKKYHAVA